MSTPGPGALRHGLELRHLPISLRPTDRHVVRSFLVAGGEEFEITGLDMPASLVPLVIGIRETPAWPHTPPRRCRLEIRSMAGTRLGSMMLTPHKRMTPGGVAVALFRPSRARTRCVGVVEGLWRYLLAWRRARRQTTSAGLHMSPPDLRALDVYYQRPRPVWLVTVPHETGFNLFPMDLVEMLEGPGRLFLCLRTTSPSVQFMRKGCGIALAAVPAALKPIIYALGSHHRAPYTVGTPLPLSTVHSATLGLDVPATAFLVTEWTIAEAVQVGSHTCFVADRVGETVQGAGEQLAHVSALFAEYARVSGAAFSQI